MPAAVPSMRDVEEWAAQDDAASLARVVRDPALPIELRTEAGARLATVYTAEPPTEGRAVLLATLDELEPRERSGYALALARTLARRLEERPEGGASEATTLARLLPSIPGSERVRLARAAIDWMLADCPERCSPDDLERLVAADPAARRRLVEPLSPRLPQRVYVGLAELLAASPEQGERARAASRFLAMEAEMRSPEHRAWIAERLDEQLALLDRPRGSSLDESRRELALDLNVEGALVHAAIPALGAFRDIPAVGERLDALAAAHPESTPTGRAARLAARGERMPEERRRPRTPEELEAARRAVEEALLRAAPVDGP